MNIIRGLVSSNKLIVKDKSMTEEEIELRGYLEQHGKWLGMALSRVDIGKTRRILY